MIDFEKMVRVAHENQERMKPCCQVQHVVVDANNLLFRVAYMQAENGPDAVVVAFLEKLVMLKWWYGAEKVHVVWEGHGKNWRYKYLPEYKANRSKAGEGDELRDLVVEASANLQSLLNGTIFRQYDPIDGEGDDGFAALAKTLVDGGASSVGIYSTDGDLLQLATSQVTLIVPQRGAPDIAMTYDKVCEKLGAGLFPWHIKQIKGLQGDTGDNIPGVPGIGIKLGSHLVAMHQTLEGVLQRAASDEMNRADDETKTAYAKRLKAELGCTEGKRELLIKHAEQARNSRDAGGIHDDVVTVIRPADLIEAATLENRLRRMEAGDYLLERVQDFKYDKSA